MNYCSPDPTYTKNSIQVKTTCIKVRGVYSIFNIQTSLWNKVSSFIRENCKKKKKDINLLPTICCVQSAFIKSDLSSICFLPQTPGKGGSQNAESEQPSTDLNHDQTSEVTWMLVIISWLILIVCFCVQGFICPQCMKSHNSAEELFKHYDLFHDTGDLILHYLIVCLCKELDKVQGQLKQVIPSRCLIFLERKLNEAETEKFNIKQMKDLFEQKAAQLATEIVDLKSRYDEEKSLREAADQRLAKLNEQLHKEKQENERLQTELLQRPGVEDVEVLQKELVQVQTLMDSMTREREEESERLKSHYEELQANYTTSEMTISQLKAELEKGPQEAAVYTQQIHQLQSNLNNLQQQSQSLSEKLARKEKEYQELEERLGAEKAAKKGVQSSLRERELEVQELQARATGAEASLQKAQAELGERTEEVVKLKSEIGDLEVKHAELKVERKQLEQQKEEKESHGAQQQTEISQLHAKLLEAERQLGEVQGRLKEQRQLSGEKLKDREQQAADLQLKLSRAEEQLKESAGKNTDLQHQLEKAKQQHQELQALQQNTNGKLREAQNDLEQVLRQIGDKDQKIQNLEALLQKSKDIVSQLEAEREDLCAKIQAGEGETAVLNQLKEKNHALQEQVTQLTDKLKNQSESNKQAQDNLHEQVQEQKTLLRSAQDRAHTLETSVTELTAHLADSKEKVAQLDAQLKAKTEMLLSAEAAKAAQKANLENNLETAQHALQDKQQELNKVQKKVEEQAQRLKERHEQSTQLETSLKECKDKLMASEQRIEQLEGLNKVCEFIESLLATTLQEELNKKAAALSDIQAQLERSEQDKVALKVNLDKVTQEGNTKHAELDRKAQSLAADFQKAQQEKEAQRKELATTQENLGKANKALKECQGQLDTERKNHKSAMGEKVGPVSCNQEQIISECLYLSLYLQAEEESKLRAQVSGFSQELASEKSRATEVQKALEQSQESLTKLQSDFYGKESEVSAMRQDLKASEEKLNLAQEELAANRTHQTGLESQIQELQTGHGSLQQELAKRDQKLQQQEQTLKELQKQQGQVKEELEKERSKVDELNKAKSVLEKNNTRLTSELKVFTEKSEKELGELREAKQLLIQQKLELQGQVEAAQSALEHEQKEHQATRDSRKKRAREEQVKRGEEAEAKMGVQVTALNENVATLKREWQGSQRRVGELEKQIDELRGEIAVLEATVQNNQDERRALLERCVKGEGEIEKLQAKVVELRRKVDDTTAAMQELGRENQSLQIKQSQSLTRKWAEDHEVQNCMACGKGFSVTIRKHHCRHCGNIFCAECSSRNALTPSSKKPVRVCETCFEELQG
uniref:Early endosome antigen 1 n=1 Tax=Dicentrarchus labrax TaxID=13489 RepID=A0A8C4I7K0_DICLA